MPLADSGNNQAKIALGYYFLVEKENRSEGLKWFRGAANSGDDEAQLHLGMVLVHILGKADDVCEGVSG